MSEPPTQRRGGGRRRAGDDGGRERAMVPRAEFRSYYGRQVLQTPAWSQDVAAYLFLGGLSAGTALLGAGADLTGRPALRRGCRVGALATIGAGAYFLVHDLGRPERFANMLRVLKPTSAMSVGSWILTAFGPGVGVAGISELLPARLRRTTAGRLVRKLARPAGLASAAVAPAVAAYTGVLLSQTAVPAWHESYPEMPFIFTASAAASAGGFGMLVAPAEAAPALRYAIYGAIVELAASRRLENRLGVVGEAYLTGRPRERLEAASMLTAAGVLGGLLFGRRSRLANVLSGLALLAGGVFERLGIFEAGVESAKDPRYLVQPQRARVEQAGPTRVPEGGR